MGQYYGVIAGNSDGKEMKAYTTSSIGGDWIGCKLMEHSWIGNRFMDHWMGTLADSPLRIAWFGDYASDNMNYANRNPDISSSQMVEWFHEGIKSSGLDLLEETETIPFVKKIDVNNKFLVNISKKCFIDMNKYIEKNTFYDEFDNSWCTHPLSILTCVGNGLGMGDFVPNKESTNDLIGKWAFDVIEVTDKRPDDYKEIEPIFKEDW